MKLYRVVIQAQVKRQIDEQFLYIAERSLDNATAWEDRLLAAIASLGATHGYGIDEDASDRQGTTIRRLVFEANYLVHYLVNKDQSTIHIIGFRHTARLPRRGEP